MTQSGYTNAVVSGMLSFLKGFANWVLRLFNLSRGRSPLEFLANNWLKLLIFLLIIGVVVDLLVWLVRWRPHWVWFHKKRVLINDDSFFDGEREVDPDDLLFEGEPEEGVYEKPRRDWQDREFTVRSEVTARRRQNDAAQKKPEIEEIDVFQDDSFDVKAKKRHSDRYEDEVFNVSNLPERPVKSDLSRKSSARAQGKQR